MFNINGNALYGQDAISQAYNYLVNENSITLAAGSTGVGIKDATDRYKLALLVEGDQNTAIAAINTMIQAGNSDDTPGCLEK